MTHFRPGPTGGVLAECNPTACMVCCRALLGYYDDPNGPPSPEAWAAKLNARFGKRAGGTA